MNLKSFIQNLIIVVVCSSSQTWADYDTDYSQTRFAKERAVYQQALIQLNSEEPYPESFYLFIDKKLAHYPLQHYWQAAYLQKTFSSEKHQAIALFLQSHKGDYIAYRLRRQWLKYLAENEHWQLFTSFYTANNSKSLQCEKLQAELTLAPEQEKSIFRKTSKLWLSGTSLPNRCNALFKRWDEAQYLTDELAWQRFELAYAANQMSLARYLSSKLNDTKKQTADKLINATTYKAYWLEHLSEVSPQKPLNSSTVKRLLKKLASTDHHSVSQLIEQSSLSMNVSDLLEIQKLCAWYYAKTDAALAQQWLSRVYSTQKNQPLEHELRFSLQARNWQQFAQLYQQADTVLQNKNEWLYWYAISLQKTAASANNKPSVAQGILKKLAQKRSFYGVLAAESIELKPNTGSPSFKTITLEAPLILQLQPALELFFVGDIKAANNSWYFATKNFSPDQWHQAAVIAQQVQWHERSIQAHAQAKLWDHTQARFPLAFIDDFTKQSVLQGIQTSWLFAMARQESAFSPLATSHAGAKGLLQLMPKTAERIAQQLSLDYDVEKLTEPSFNIALGAKYLKDMLERFDGNYILATAAYNAGPHRVREWINLRPITDDWEHWVATIPYKETRNYVQNILAFCLIYQAQLDKEKTPSLEFFAPKKLALSRSIVNSDA